VGDYGTGGSPSVSFEWTWKWKPPKPVEDKGGGWRNCCSVSIETILVDLYYGNAS
jgi:Arf-GAP/SH3 domain/ANK repeat/PH domain-containing protein